MSILAEICDRRRTSVAARAREVPSARLLARASARSTAPASLSSSLRACAATGAVAVIAEHKRRAPSSGPLGNPPPVETVVGGYERAGAAGISVLTEADYFDGSLEDLRVTRQTVSTPILRKDFTVDPYQIAESAAEGASAILLIAAAIGLVEARDFATYAHDLGLEVLLELHDASELDYLSIEPEIVGVNNRNLVTMRVDLEAGERLFAQLPTGGPVRISESGIHTPAHAARMLAAGYEGLLIGTQFMRTPDPAAALHAFLADTRAVLQDAPAS